MTAFARVEDPIENDAEALKNSPSAIGDIIDQLEEVAAERSELSKRDKELKELQNALEEQLIAALDEQKLKSGAGTRYSATITEAVVPNVKDWDAVWDYIVENRMEYIVKRQLNASAWRELFQSGELVPGTEPYEKRGISFRKL